MPIYDRDPNNPLDALEPEQIRELFNRAVEDEATNNQSARAEQAARDFLEANPAYVANARNGAILQTALEYSGTAVQSFQDIERIYNDLTARGLLELDVE